MSKVVIVKINDDSKLLLGLKQQQYLPEEVFCSVLLYLSLKESDCVLFELRWVVCRGTWFICVLDQLVRKACKPVRKEKLFNHQKNLIHDFLRNW